MPHTLYLSDGSPDFLGCSIGQLYVLVESVGAFLFFLLTYTLPSTNKISRLIS